MRSFIAVILVALVAFVMSDFVFYTLNLSPKSTSFFYQPSAM